MPKLRSSLGSIPAMAGILGGGYGHLISTVGQTPSQRQSKQGLGSTGIGYLTGVGADVAMQRILQSRRLEDFLPERPERLVRNFKKELKRIQRAKWPESTKERATRNLYARKEKQNQSIQKYKKAKAKFFKKNKQIQRAVPVATLLGTLGLGFYRGLQGAKNEKSKRT